MCWALGAVQVQDNAPALGLLHGPCYPGTVELGQLFQVIRLNISVHPRPSLLSPIGCLLRPVVLSLPRGYMRLGFQGLTHPSPLCSCGQYGIQEINRTLIVLVVKVFKAHYP